MSRRFSPIHMGASECTTTALNFWEGYKGFSNVDSLGIHTLCYKCILCSNFYSLHVFTFSGIGYSWIDAWELKREGDTISLFLKIVKQNHQVTENIWESVAGVRYIRFSRCSITFARTLIIFELCIVIINNK